MTETKETTEQQDQADQAEQQDQRVSMEKAQVANVPETDDKPRTVTHEIEVEDSDEPLKQVHLTNPPTTHEQYKVEGYNVINPEYDQPYLDSAHLDPGERFKFGGDPVQAAKHLEDYDPQAVQINQAKADLEDAEERLRRLDYPQEADGRNYVPTADESNPGFKRDQARVPVEDSTKTENENVPTYDEVNPDAPQPPEVPEPDDSVGRDPEDEDSTTEDEVQEQPSDSFVNEETAQANSGNSIHDGSTTNTEQPKFQ